MKTIRKQIQRLAGVLLALLLTAWSAGAAGASAADMHDHTGWTELNTVSGEITESGRYYLSGDCTLPAGLVISGGKVELCLNGYLLTAASGNYVLQVKNGAELTISDCYMPETHPGDAYVHQYITPKSEEKKPEYVTVAGGLITGNNARGCIQVTDAVLHFTGGTVAGGKAANGGGISIARSSSGTGEVHLYDGAAVRDNAATVSGGGVYVPQLNHGGFTMHGGVIADNTAATSGGGVYVGIMSRMDMEGGVITGNAQTRGGTQASYGGGGVFCHTSSELAITGGTITGNASAAKGGGVLLSAGCGMRLAGMVQISDNRQADADSNLCLLYNTMPQGLAKITLTGPLAEGARIGLNYTHTALDTPVSLVTAAEEYAGGTVSGEDFARFFSDDTTRSLLWNEDGAVLLCVGRVHAVCGAACTHGPNGEAIHTQAVFQPVDASFTGGILAEGSYYLNTDLILTQPVTVSGGTVNLCLNGYELRNPAGRVFQVTSGGTLTLCDCYDASTHPGSAYTHTYKNPQTKADVTVTGGLVSGNHSLTTQSGGIEVTGGALYLYGGTVGGASGLGGVRVTDGGQFDMLGGTIADCLSRGSGGGVYADADSRFSMAGGEILSNRARSLGGGIYAENGFQMAGNVKVIGNIVGVAENNVYLPQGTYINVTGPVSGMVGITMERRGVFTTGGAAPYVRSFRADASVGTFADVQGRELCLSGYGISVQPTPETRTVVMRSPENVAAYQWYAMEPGTLDPSQVTGGMCAYDPAGDLWTHTFAVDTDDLELFELRLGEGDTLRVTSQSGLGSVSLMETVQTEDGSVLETSVFCGAPDYEGFFDVTAVKSGTYTLCAAPGALWQAGDGFSASVALYTRGDPAAGQTGATYTGGGGYHICKIAYDDGETVLYSAPFMPGTHRHALCGAVCTHDGHSTVTYTPIAHTLAGGLLAGEALRADFTLESGSYYLPADLTLADSLKVPSGASVVLCLNGKKLHCASASGILVEAGGTLQLCDCAGGGTVSGCAVQDGGGLDLRGDAVLYAGTFTGGSAVGHGGGIYVAATGGLTLSGGVQVKENVPDDLYLAAGRTVILTEALPETSLIGIAMEQPGQVTVGADAGAMDRFFPNEAGTFLVQTETGEVALRAYSIVAQPTVGNPTVVVGQPEDANYQWYTAASAAVVDPGDPRCDGNTGLWTPDANGICCTLHLERWQVLRAIPDAPLPEGATVTLGDWPLMLAEDGSWLVTAADAGAYALYCSEQATFRLELYTADTPAEGQNSNTLTAKMGAYVCRVTWPSGHELQSRLLILQEKDAPDAPVFVPAKPEVCPFTDLEPEAWYYPAVMKAYRSGWMVGTEETRFSPNMPISRGMLVTILWRLAGCPAPADPMPFVDVPEEAYYWGAVCWAAEHGVAVGMDAQHFCPEEEATREQAAAFFHRYALAFHAALLNSETPSQWAENDVQWAVAIGLLVGDPAGRIDPTGALTRAQTAMLLTRFQPMI